MPATTLRSLTLLSHVWLIVPGILLGAYATLIGAGGGFVIVPLLLLLNPEAHPKSIAAISLAVVLVNSLSGTIAYWRLRRIDIRAGKLFALFVIPGSVLGVLATDLFTRGAFDTVFGVVLVAAAVFLALSPGGERGSAPQTTSPPGLPLQGGSNPTHRYDPKVGCGLSFLEGVFSSMLGIGGGIVQVPLLVRVLRFPPHVATATSQFIVAVMAFVATGVHVLRGSLAPGEGLSQAAPLALGVAIGAQLGAWQSGRFRGPTLVRLLTLGLGFIGIRLLLG